MAMIVAGIETAGDAIETNAVTGTAIVVEIGIEIGTGAAMATGTDTSTVLLGTASWTMKVTDTAGTSRTPHARGFDQHGPQAARRRNVRRRHV